MIFFFDHDVPEDAAFALERAALVQLIERVGEAGLVERFTSPEIGRAATRRGATFDGSRGFQPTDGDVTGMIRRGATIESEGHRRE